MAIIFTIMGWGHYLAMSMNFKLNLQYSLSQCQIFAMQYDSDLKKWVVPKFFAHTHTLSLSHSLSLTLILWLLERITAHSAARQCLTFQLFGNFYSSFLAIISFWHVSELHQRVTWATKFANNNVCNHIIWAISKGHFYDM